MQHLHVKKTAVKVCLFVLIAITTFTSSARAGLDYYQIFIGKKMIYERYVNKPLDLQSLSISAADANEMLTIYYFQCNAPDKTGSNRTVALKDEKGYTVKQWSFKNAQGTQKGMIIPVKELLQLQNANKNNALALYYTAEGLTEGMKLAFVQTASKAVTYMQQDNGLISEMARQVINILFKIITVV